MARKPKTRRCQPIDTKRLLKSPEVIKRATDLVQNSIGRRCDARTRGADGMRQVDLYRAKGHVGLQADLARLLELPLDQVKKQIPPLRMTTIRPGEEPWGPRYDPIARFLLGMSDEEPAAKKERDVAIPTPWGDCIIRAFDEVLQQTFQPHRSARAYRRGLQDPVHGILWEASKAVRGGARFWSVLDIKNFFPSMDHGHIRESLETQGFDSWFVDRLMALIQTQAIWDDGTVESITRGCQAGMRISGTIANLYLFELDQLVEKTFQARVHYSRYSDDILILATKRHEAVGAARLIRRWLKKHNHEVKGVSERMSADSLVHEITKRPLDVLGARILCCGDILMQPSRTEQVKTKLKERVKLHQQLGPVIAGVSQYTNRAWQRGRYAFDADDIEDMLQQVEQYWGLLNGPRTKDFLDDIRRETGAGLGHSDQDVNQTWVTWIPSRSGHLVGGANRAHQMTADQLQRLLTPMVQTQPQGAPSGTSGTGSDIPRAGSIKGESSWDTQGEAPPIEKTVARGPKGQRRVSVHPEGDSLPHNARQGAGGWGAEDGTLPQGSQLSVTHDGHQKPKDSHPRKQCGCTEARGEKPERRTRLSPTGDGGSIPNGVDPDGVTHRLDTVPPNDLVHRENGKDLDDDLDLEHDLSEVDQVGISGVLAGAVGSPRRGTDQRVVEISVISSERRRPYATVIASLGPFGRREVTCGLPEQSALVEAVRAEVRLAQRAGVRILVSRIPTWLPKALLKSSARFHSVVLFDLVERLHAEVARGDTDVVLVGARDDSAREVAA